MSEKLYAIKESTMAAIAASLRNVAGTTEPISGDEISSYVTTTLPTAILENLDEVISDQDDIIAQIQTALEGKASATPILQAKTVTIVEQATGKNLASGSTKAFIYADSTNNSASQTSGTLVYTGAQSLVYVIPVLAVVAIASLIVIKKRS